MSDPIRAATMPIRIVSQIGMSWRPSIQPTQGPDDEPTTMALMMSPSTLSQTAAVFPMAALSTLRSERRDRGAG